MAAEIISVSINSMQGGPEELEGIKQLFYLFAFVPEDTHLPSDVVCLLFDAIYDTKVPALYLRKWTQQLINRR